MILSVIVVVILIAIVGLVVNMIMDSLSKEDKYIFSLKESMDLVELPIITFYVGDKKLNFLLDTGSNLSHINAAVLDSIPYTPLNVTSEIAGIEGNKQETGFCELYVKTTNEGSEFIEMFAVSDLSGSFGIVKEESGVQLHGILGSVFFKKYKYIIDFDNLKVYFKK